MPGEPHPNNGFLKRAHTLMIVFGGIYAAIVVLLTLPGPQRHAIYCHALRFPLWARYDLPEKYGIAPFKTTDVRIYTADNETLGAWFTLPEQLYYSQPRHTPLDTSIDSSVLRDALRTHQTVLYLHGNAGTRAISTRIEYYRMYSSRLSANVLAPDYRGFADSTGTPSEAGLIEDARAAFKWLTDRGANPSDILVVGISLGTGVAVQLVHGLEQEGVTPKGLVLLAPFSGIAALLDTYYILGLVPLMAPLKTFPFVGDAVKWFLQHQFDSLAKITELRVPVLIAHAEDDWDIPMQHSEMLFEAFLGDNLPSITKVEGTEAQLEVLRARVKARETLVETTELERVGRAETYVRQQGGRIVWVRTHWGGHNRVGLQEGLVDYMAGVFYN